MASAMAVEEGDALLMAVPIALKQLLHNARIALGHALDPTGLGATMREHDINDFELRVAKLQLETQLGGIHLPLSLDQLYGLCLVPPARIEDHPLPPMPMDPTTARIAFFVDRCLYPTRPDKNKSGCGKEKSGNPFAHQDDIFNNLRGHPSWDGGAGPLADLLEQDIRIWDTESVEKQWIRVPGGNVIHVKTLSGVSPLRDEFNLNVASSPQEFGIRVGTKFDLGHEEGDRPMGSTQDCVVVVYDGRTDFVEARET